ncbi:MAG: DNA adenine methylase [Candidatus Omnitrophica bacterium]|nr:DNA adenine methylase [Candidatus Omnitrophota bacterium]
MERQYFNFTPSRKEIFYYEKREEYNEFIAGKIPNHVVRRTALIIFLNKTCFNGLFRVNSKGLFNVPFGRYTNPTICDEENLLAVSHMLKNVEINCCDFSVCLEKANSKTFVYFDPPYRPVSKTSNFTSYIKHGFDDPDQKRLKDIYDQLNKLDV